MTTEEFRKIYYNPRVAECLWAQVRRRSSVPEIREEFAQEAWLAISTAPSNSSFEFLKELISKTIYSCYWQENKERLLFEAMPPAAIRQRVIYYDEKSGGPQATYKDLY